MELERQFPQPARAKRPRGDPERVPSMGTMRRERRSSTQIPTLEFTEPEWEIRRPSRRGSRASTFDESNSGSRSVRARRRLTVDIVGYTCAAGPLTHDPHQRPLELWIAVGMARNACAAMVSRGRARTRPVVRYFSAATFDRSRSRAAH